MAQRSIDCASIDRNKEVLADLAPAHKTRIFFRGVESRNQIGWIHRDKELVQNVLTVSRTAKQQVQKLFEINTDLTPAHLLSVVDRGMKKYHSRPMPKEYEGAIYYHFQHFTNICHLINGLDRVVTRLGMANELPKITFLNAPSEELDEEEDEEKVA